MHLRSVPTGTKKRKPARAKGAAMGEKSPEARRFESTDELREILVFAQDRPFDYFERYSIKEIREVCVQGMYRQRMSSQNATWAQECIKGLLQNGDREMAQKVLEWYIFEPAFPSAEKDAVEFALSLLYPHAFYGGDCHYIKPDALLKMIAGKLKKAPHIYPSIRGLDKFFGAFLKQLANSTNNGQHYYYSDCWCQVERVVTVIALVEDTSYLPTLQELSALFGRGKLRPYDEKGPLTKEMHLALINATIKILQKKIKKG